MTGPALWASCIVGAYLAGAIPFGLLIGFAKGIDLRAHGSKNIGATNAGRVLGRHWGFVCFALDVAKGAAPVAVAGWLTGAMTRSPQPLTEALLWIGVAAAAVVGHMHSVFINFKGGKGVATGFGVLLGLYGYLTWPVLIALAVWLIVVRVTHYVSVSSCVAAATIPVSLLAFSLAGTADRGLSPAASVREAWPFLALSAFLAVLVIWKHRANFARLRAGTESKVWLSKPAPKIGTP